MKITSVRLSLLLWNIGVLALVLFGFLIVTHFAVRTYLVNSIDHRLAGIATGASRFMERFEENRRPPMPPPGDNLRELRTPGAANTDRTRNENRRARMMRLFDLHGKPMTLFGRQPDEQDVLWDKVTFTLATGGTPAYSFVQDGDTQLRVLSHPLLREKQQIGVVQVAMSFEDTKILLDSLTLMLLLLVPCALVVAGASGWLLTKRTLHPVGQLAETAEHLNPDDLSQRLPVAGGDEFAHLATTMNGMLGRLEDTFISLRQAIERERRFTADASHELRTPLTAIKANARLALKGERTPAQYRESLMAIDQASETMQRLIQDMLLLARSDSHSLALTPQELEPGALFADAMAIVPRGDGHAEICIDIPDPTLTLWGDAHYLHRLVVNLLENALRHTPATGSVTLSATAHDGGVQLTVSDTGEGIPTEHLAHLGERFYRVDSSRTRGSGGAGLGLAICTTIVHAHRGIMRITSTFGEGTQVTVQLPSMPAA